MRTKCVTPVKKLLNIIRPSIYVRNPAGRFFMPLSRPMNPPIRIDDSRRNIVSSKVISLRTIRLIKTSAVNFPLVLWTLQTSCSSLLLRSLLKCVCKTSPGYSHALSLFTRRIYRKRFCAAIGLHFMPGTVPCIRPCMRFLFVQLEICHRLSSDSASRQTPLA